jgi:hypothetical protein
MILHLLKKTPLVVASPIECNAARSCAADSTALGRVGDVEFVIKIIAWVTRVV